MFSKRKNYIGVVILFFIFILGCFYIDGQKENISKLAIKKVSTFDMVAIKDDYEYGKYRYPEYKMEGLSESFAVKKVPDIKFKVQEIISIQINKMPFTPKELNAYTIKIYFSSTGASKILDYTKENIGNQVAFEVDGKILSIVTIIDEISNEMNIAVANKTIDELINSLSKLTANITIDKN